jgi:hypothetical protein
MHRDGTGWKWFPSRAGLLYGVTVISPRNIWAVDTLVLHWNGTKLKQVPTPVRGTLLAVDASSPTHVWAVGEHDHGSVRKTLVLRCNGTAWKRVASPNPAGSAGSNLNVLDGVAAISRENVWAVGFDGSRAPVRNTLILHWNGTKWKHVPSPNPGGSNGSVLARVAATSASNVWAVGGYSVSTAFSRTLIARWTGTKWKQVASPNPGGTSAPAVNTLHAVAATSAVNVWAVGWSAGPEPGESALAIHRC